MGSQTLMRERSGPISLILRHVCITLRHVSRIWLGADVCRVCSQVAAALSRTAGSTCTHAQLRADIRLRTRCIITAYTWKSYRLHGTKRRTHKKRKKAGKKQILLLLIVTYNDREARGEQCNVVCNPLLTSSLYCSCCSSHATSDEKIVPPQRIDVTSFPSVS